MVPSGAQCIPGAMVGAGHDWGWCTAPWRRAMASPRRMPFHGARIGPGTVRPVAPHTWRHGYPSRSGFQTARHTIRMLAISPAPRSNAPSTHPRVLQLCAAPPSQSRDHRVPIRVEEGGKISFKSFKFSACGVRDVSVFKCLTTVWSGVC